MKKLFCLFLIFALLSGTAAAESNGSAVIAPEDAQTAWTPYTFGEYTTAVMNGWTETSYDDETGFTYFYYGENFSMFSVSDLSSVKEEPVSAEMIDSLYQAAVDEYITPQNTEVFRETIAIGGNTAMRALVTMYSVIPADLIFLYIPETHSMFEFTYVRMQGDDTLRDEIIRLVIENTSALPAEE